MAVVRLTCPKCQKRLETSDENLGREGQCPSCETVLPITTPRLEAARRREPGESGGGWLAGAPEDYQDPLALWGSVALGVSLLLLGLSPVLRWSAFGRASEFLSGEKMAFVVASLLCCAFLAVTLIGRKSLAPAALVGGAWAVLALIWSAGLLHALDNPKIGGYVGLGASLLAALAAAHVCYRCRAAKAFARIGVLAGALLLLAVIFGILTVKFHVKGRLETAASGRPSRPPAARPHSAQPADSPE